MEITASNFNMESLINEVSADLAKGDIEDKKITAKRIEAHTDNLRDQRQDRIKNLKDQIRGVHNNGGGCFKVFKAVFKVLDFLAKPLSLLTANTLKLNLEKTLDQLKEAKNQKGVILLQAHGQEILKVIENLKKFLGDDMETLKKTSTLSDKETTRIRQIMDEVEESFRSTQQV